MEDLELFVKGFSDKLDSESVKNIKETLKVNGFTSTIKLKLISDKDLETMFQGSITLGARNLLSYQIELLRDESPLVTKKLKKKLSTSSAVVHTSMGSSNIPLNDAEYEAFDEVEEQPEQSKGVSTSPLFSFLYMIFQVRF